MTEKLAVITGAGRGIGRATAIELAQRGYQLLLVSRTDSELAETARIVGRGDIFPADAGNAAAVQSIVERAMDRFGRIDALVNCAGAAPQATADEITLAQWQDILSANLSPIVYFTRLLWPIWRCQGGGVMVNISSFAARDPRPGLGFYGAAKAAINALGLSLAREGEPLGIRVHTVAPAATETTMFRALFSESEVPSEKTLAPREVARVIAQCVCGDLAVSSGEVIYVHKPV